MKTYGKPIFSRKTIQDRINSKQHINGVLKMTYYKQVRSQNNFAYLYEHKKNKDIGMPWIPWNFMHLTDPMELHGNPWIQL